jgi:hypothetical protein
VLVAAVFTRYDGWIMALLAWVAIGVTLARRGQLRSRAFWLASVLVVAAPAAWFVYNAAAFGDWLFFMRGPTRPRRLRFARRVPGIPAASGLAQSMGLAFCFIMKAAEMDAPRPRGATRCCC